jgi:hypothetical protein
MKPMPDRQSPPKTLHTAKLARRQGQTALIRAA